MPILSVIIPVYNAGDRIEKCVRSIQLQTLRDIEIIIINDGSTDGSYEILERLSGADERIKLLSFPNGGAALARNRGLQIATGRYVGFVDADDWIEPKMYEKLTSAIETDQSDLAVCNIRKEFDDKSETVLDFQDHEILFEELLEKFIRFEFDYAIYNKVYKRDFIVAHSISFENDLRLSQDGLFNMYVFAFANSVSIIPQPFYHYVIKEGSLMTSPQDKRIESFNHIIRSFRRFCEENHKEKEWDIFKVNIGPGYQKYLFNLVLKSAYTERLNFFSYYHHVLRHLELMDPLLLYFPQEQLSRYQQFRKGLLQKRSFKTFSLLAAIRHKVFR